MRSTTLPETIAATARAYNNARSIALVFARMAENPICGKPKRGFKAARKARKLAHRWQAIAARERALIDAWIARDGKASKIERERRTARVIELIPDWSANNA